MYTKIMNTFLSSRNAGTNKKKEIGKVRGLCMGFQWKLSCVM